MVVKSSFLSVLCCIASVLLALFGGATSEAADSLAADILLKGGTIFDGSGNEGIVGDVAICGDRIVGVGTFPLKGAKWEIDCRGLAIAPGFIDLHTHCDGPLVRPATRANVNYLMQGCTTVVTGNCGSGPFDVAEFYDKIDAAGAGTNVVHLLPQGSVRSRVMGTAERKATVDELAEMRRLADQGMSDGAWGMSTGLIYVPSSYADTNELVEIAKVVAAHGGIHASHIRNENTEVLEAVNEVIEIGRRAALPTHISHFKSSGRDAWGLVRRA
ncbi:MAG: amidohydrolase family protein, partial [Phycisphaerales bacterium]